MKEVKIYSKEIHEHLLKCQAEEIIVICKEQGAFLLAKTIKELFLGGKK